MRPGGRAAKRNRTDKELLEYNRAYMSVGAFLVCYS